jgi:hypothetical protein
MFSSIRVVYRSILTSLRQTVLNLMVEFTDVTSQELNRVITNMLLDYVATAVKEIDVLDWAKETDKPLCKP